MKRGFTVVEVLIVVIVISILASIGIAAYGSVRSQANDDKRRSDIAIVQAELERYYQKNNEFPYMFDPAFENNFFRKISNYQNIKDPADTLGADAARLGTSPFCSAAYFPTRASACRGYAYLSVNDSGTGSTGYSSNYFGDVCSFSVSRSNSNGSQWYVLAYYNETEKQIKILTTVKSSGDTLTFSETGSNASLPDQDCIVDS